MLELKHSCLDSEMPSNATAADGEAGDSVIIALPPDPNARIDKYEYACLKCTCWPCIVQWYFMKAVACRRCSGYEGTRRGGKHWNKTFQAAIDVLRAGAGNMVRSICFIRLFTDPPIGSLPKWFPTLPSHIGCESNTTAPNFCEDSSCCGGRAGEWYFPSDHHVQEGKAITGPCCFPSPCCCISHHPGNPEDADSTRPTRLILYFHGGAFCLCTPQTHRALLYRLVDATGAVCLAVDYRRPPEHPWPVPVDDCFLTYKWLISDGGYSPSEIVFAGDSAGGGLVLAVMGKVRDVLGKESLPAGGVMLSPWLNLTDSFSGSWTQNQDTDFLPRDWGAMFANAYAGVGTDKPHTLAEVSPCRVDPLGLPPLLVEVGGGECLRDQILDWVKTSREAGEKAGVEVDVQCTPSEGMVHVFPLFYLMATDDAEDMINASFDRISEFVTRVLGPDPHERKALRSKNSCAKCLYRCPWLPCICCVVLVLVLLLHVLAISWGTMIFYDEY